MPNDFEDPEKSGGLHVLTYAVPLEVPGYVQLVVVVTPLPAAYAQGLAAHLRLAVNNYLADRHIVSGQMSPQPPSGRDPKAGGGR